MKSYAYGIMVKGHKRVGGVIHADSMEDAVQRIVRRENGRLTINRKESVYRPCDGAIIPQSEWLFDGDKAYVYVWARPEDFRNVG